MVCRWAQSLPLRLSGPVTLRSVIRFNYMTLHEYMQWIQVK